jgi:hypothetical protein
MLDDHRRAAACVLTVVVAACASPARQSSGRPFIWSAVRSPDCSFTLRMPRADPTRDEYVQDDTRVVAHTVHVGAGIIFDARCFLLRTEPLDQPAAEAAMREHAARNRANAAASGKPVRISSLTLGRCPGYDAILDAPEERVHIRTRTLRAPDRLYVLILTGPPDESTPVIWQHYVDSFRATPCDVDT